MHGKLWSNLWDPLRNPWLFVVVLYLTAISTNLWSALIDDRSPWWWFFVALWPPILGLVAWRFVRFRAQSAARRAEPARGLVVLVSGGPGSRTAAAAARHHLPRLEHLWLVHSEASKKPCQDLQAELIAAGSLAAGQLHALPLTDDAFQDLEAVRQLIEAEVFGALPGDLQERDVVIDFTGGTKETSAGAVLAGLPPGRRLQRTPMLQKDPTRLTGLEPGEPIEIDINYRLRPVRRR